MNDGNTYKVSDLSDLPDDDELKFAVAQAEKQMRGLHDALEYNFLSVQIVRGEDHKINVALVAHNPCNLRQYQLLAFLPTMDSSLAALESNEEVGKQIAKMEESGEMPPEVAEQVGDLCVKRFTRASMEDPEKLIRLTRAPNFETARAVYQEIHGLTEGGDFNHPLQ